MPYNRVKAIDPFFLLRLKFVEYVRLQQAIELLHGIWLYGLA